MNYNECALVEIVLQNRVKNSPKCEQKCNSWNSRIKENCQNQGKSIMKVSGYFFNDGKISN